MDNHFLHALVAKSNHIRCIAVVIVCIGLLLSGCRSDIDLNNIDSTSELEVGIALPIGSMHATVGNFIGNVQNIYIDSLHNKGVITWKDTFKIERHYHQVDLSKHISSKDFYLNVYDKLEAANMIGIDGQIIGTGKPITLYFDLPLKLKGINDSTMHERLDSALIDNASFVSVINPHNLPLEWEWIDEVRLELGEQINRPRGNTMIVYKKGDIAAGYNQSIPTSIDNFSICMMKNKNLNPQTDYHRYATNVIDSCVFRTSFTFTIPAGQKVSIPSDAKFRYDLSVQFIDYTAIWGMFEQSKDMYDEDIVDLTKDNLGDLDFILHSDLPFADPKIDMHIVTQVAGAMVMQGDYLFAEDIKGNRSYADFNGSRQRYVYFTPDEYLDPITSPIGDSTTNMVVLFDKDPARGQIDRLFNNIPQKLGYKFNVDFNFIETPQIRIVPNTGIRIEASCTLPLIFNEGLAINYKDTINDINLSEFSIDSLIATVPIIDSLKASTIKIVLSAENTIPLSLKASLRCMDATGNIIMDPKDVTKPFQLFQEDTIRLDPPKYAQAGGFWNMTEVGKTTIIATLDKSQLDLIPHIKHIQLAATIDDQALRYAYELGMFNVRITEDASIKLKIGLATKIHAVLDFESSK